MTVCFATNNAHKISEVQALLGGGIRLLSLKAIGCEAELPEETDSLEGNSQQKAQFVFKNFHCSCFADDSGLEVFAIGGEPGVHSAHYAGPERDAAKNIEKLLRKLEGITDRRARFRAVITLTTPGVMRQFEGSVPGVILTAPRGSGGFGYDPVFLPDGYSQTFAEMTVGEKNKFSHRAVAVNQLVDFLKHHPAALH